MERPENAREAHPASPERNQGDTSGTPPRLRGVGLSNEAGTGPQGKPTTQGRSGTGVQRPENVIQPVALNPDQGNRRRPFALKVGKELVRVARVLVFVAHESRGVADRVEVSHDGVGFSPGGTTKIRATVGRHHAIRPGEPSRQGSGSEVASREDAQNPWRRLVSPFVFRRRPSASKRRKTRIRWHGASVPKASFSPCFPNLFEPSWG